MGEEQQRGFRGIFIPAFIWEDERLNALEKVILMEIDSLDNDEEKGCWASNEHLAKFCQCTSTKISTAIKKLKELDYIELISFDGRHRNLKIKNQTLKNLKADYKKNKSSNINNNTINNNTINSINKEKPKKSKKQQNYIDIYNMLEEFTTNENVKKALKKYLKVRTTERSLNVEQWNIILTNLRNECGTDSKYALQLIEQATVCGWMQIVYPNKFSGTPKASYSSKPTFDNTINHDIGKSTLNDTEFNKLTDIEKEKYLEKLPVADMTPLQKEYFNNNCLVKDWK